MKKFPDVMLRNLVILVIVLCPVMAFTQDPFKAMIDSTYNFHPHKLKREQINALIPSLDRFFDLVGSDTTKYLPLLRQELRGDGHFPYFYYDGGHLLLIKSERRADLELAAASFAKCFAGDPAPKTYLGLVMYVASKNIDVTPAALNILNDSTFQFPLIEHAMVFSQGYCLTYAVSLMKPSLYVRPMIDAFKTTDDSGKKSIVTALWFAYSCEGDAFLRSLNETNTTKEIADYAQKLLSSNNVASDYKKRLKKSSLDELELIRKDALKHFSDEAILDLDFVTKAKRSRFACEN